MSSSQTAEPSLAAGSADCLVVIIWCDSSFLLAEIFQRTDMEAKGWAAGGWVVGDWSGEKENGNEEGGGSECDGSHT